MVSRPQALGFGIVVGLVAGVAVGVPWRKVIDILHGYLTHLWAATGPSRPGSGHQAPQVLPGQQDHQDRQGGPGGQSPGLPVDEAADLPVEEGSGYGEVRLGASPALLHQALGQPDQEDPSWISYQRSHGIDLRIQDGAVAEIRFNPGFKGSLVSGPGIGTPREEVFRIYGEPRETRWAPSPEGLYGDRILHEGSGGSKIIYEDRGVLFWFDTEKRVSQFVVFDKKI